MFHSRFMILKQENFNELPKTYSDFWHAAMF